MGEGYGQTRSVKRNLGDVNLVIKRHGWSGFWLFLKEILSHPTKVGALAPSSDKLAKALAAQVKFPGNEDYIVEIGAGTGAITHALLERGIPVKNIIVIERAKNLVEHLNKRFPRANILEGDAVDLSKLLNGDNQRITTVVSSLPLRSLPEQTVKQIIEQLEKVLSEGGQYIHYTYSFTAHPTELSAAFKHQHSLRIWQNIPPAKVEVFLKK